MRSKLGIVFLGIVLFVTSNLLAQNNALRFNGTNQYFYSSGYSAPTTMTMEAWIKPSSISAQLIACHSSASSPTVHISNGLFLKANGTVEAFVYDGGSKLVTSTTALSANTWYHLALTCTNSGQLKLYINGTEEGTAVSVGTQWNGGNRYYFGHSGGGRSYFQGDMDEFRIWNVVRTQSQISTNRTNSLTTATGLITNYTFNQSSGNVTDQSGGSKTGILVNSPTYVSSGAPLSSSSVAKLVITEIMYNPPESGSDTAEYIEIYNNDTAAVNLNGYSFSQGFVYTFPNITLDTGEYIVLTVDSNGFKNRYGKSAYEWTSGVLGGNGEDIILKDNLNRTVDSVEYDDVSPWPTGPPSPDGGGASIVFENLLLDNSNGANWTIAPNPVSGKIVQGYQIYGSPGEATPVVAQNSAISFTGSSSHAILGTFPTSTAYTIEMWIKADSVDKDRALITHTSSTGPSANVSHCIYISGGKFKHYTFDNVGGGKAITGNTTILANTWYHVAITSHNGDSMRLFVNGVEDATPFPINTSWNGGDRFYLGATNVFHTAKYKGLIDEVRIWNVARNAGQLSRNKYVSPSIQSSLLGYYSFNQSSGNPVDSSGNSRNGTLVHSPTYSKPGITVNSSNAVSASITAYTHPYCLTDLYGSITVTTPPGSGNYKYSWSNGSSSTNDPNTSHTIANLSPGLYRVTVSDVNSADTVWVRLNPQYEISTSIFIDSATECNGATGAITANVSGSSTAYSYLWSNGGTTASISSLSKNSYTLIVKDSVGCADTVSVDLPNKNGMADTWTETSPYSNVLYSMAYGNGRFVSVGRDSVKTSTDGTNWISVTSSPISGKTYYSVTFGDSLFVAVGNGVMMTSPDGTNWTSRTVPAFTLWNNVTYGNNKFVSVGYNTGNTSLGLSMISSDGISWAMDTIPLYSTPVDIKYGGGLFVTLGYTANKSKNIATSSDGKNWTVRSIPIDYLLRTAYGNGKWTILGINAGATSADGITWTVNSSKIPNQRYVYDMTYGGGVFAAVFRISANGVTKAVATSTDGVTWLLQSTPRFSALGIAYGDNKFAVCAARYSGIITAEVKTFIPTNVSIAIDSAITCDGDSNAVLSASVTGGTAPYSYIWSNSDTGASISGIPAGMYVVTITDCLGDTVSKSITLANPTAIQPFIYADSASDCKSSNGTLAALVANGTGGYSYNWSSGSTGIRSFNASAGTYTLTVTDGNNCTGTNNFKLGNKLGIAETWTSETSFGHDTEVKKVTYGKGLYVAVGEYMYSSTDGVNWVKRTTSSNYMRDVAFGSGFFVASRSTKIMISTDGVVWINSSTNTTSSSLPTTITYGNGKFVGIGKDSSFTSTDGINWTAHSLPISTSSHTYDELRVEFGNGLFVSVIGNKGVFTSPDGITWTKRIASSPIRSGLVYGNGKWVLIGSDLSYTSSDGITWTSQFFAGGSANVFDLTYGAGLYVVPLRRNRLSTANTNARTAGVILTSPDAVNWTAQKTDFLTLYGITYSNNKFVAVGRGAITSQVIAFQSSSVAIQIDSSISCPGDSNAVISAVASSGLAPYSYLWSTNDTTAQISGLDTGIYSVTITDCNGDTASKSITLQNPLPIVASITTDSSSLCGQSTGGFTASATNGTTPYTYAWSNSSTTASITGLAKGSYSVTVTDNFGCNATATDTIRESNAILIQSITATNDTLCNFGDSTTITTASSQIGVNYYLHSGGTNIGPKLGTGSSLSFNTGAINSNNSEYLLYFEYDKVLSTAEGKSLEFDGVDDYVNCGNNSSLNPTTAFTLEAWINPSAFKTATSGGTFIEKTTSVNRDGYMLRTGSTGKVDFYFGTGSWKGVSTSSNAVSLNTWTHVAGVYDGSTVKIYINGILKASSSASGTVKAGSANLHIGRSSYYPLRAYQGKIDEVRIWNIARTQSEISNSKNRKLNGNTTGLLAYYSMESGSGTTALDGASTNNGSLINMNSSSAWKVGLGEISSCENYNYKDTVRIKVANLQTNVTTTNNVSCNGGANGSITSSVSGGTGNKSYTWSNGDTTASISALVAGTYSLTVTDKIGCTVMASDTITEPTALVASATQDTAASCPTASNGVASCSATGGTGNYTYVWSNSVTATSNSGLSPATYIVTVTDTNSCTDTASITIGSNSTLVASAVVDSNVTCFGLSNGKATVSVTGGASPFTYSWSNSDTTKSSNGLAIGSYYVSVTDGNSCTDSASVSITQPLKLVATANVDSNVSCYNGSNGQATVAVNGGTTLYSYEWSNHDTNATATGLSAGSFYVTVTDKNGCTDTGSVTITEPAAILAPIAVTKHVSCKGNSDGGLKVTPSGGTTPYSYKWSGSSVTNDSLVGKSAGIYSVTVTDAKGCTISTLDTIVEPNLLVASASVTSSFNGANISCNGSTDGEATASVAGGNTGFSYAWNTGATTAQSSSLSAGTYYVTIMDSKGCYDSASVTLTQPIAVSASTTLDSAASCPTASNGGATASGSGGTSTYTYAWSNSTSNAALTAVIPGKYTVTVTDKNSCTDTASITIGSSSTLAANAVVDSNVACFGQSNGMATASATGGASPFTYSWSNSKTTASASGLIAGTYYVTVTDGNTCSDSASVTIAQPTVLVATGSVDSNVTCNGGSNGQATVAVNGGTTLYSYEWSNHDTNATATGLSAGSFYVTVTDKNGCTDTGSATITEPAAMIAIITVDSNVSCYNGSDGGATAAASGGSTPYSYNWNNSATTSSITGVSANSYSVTITDKNGCNSSATKSITHPTQLNASASVTSSYNGANISCYGSSDGEATASATGGTATYSYAWSNSTSNAIATSLGTGSFVVTVTDAKGCTDTASVSLTEPTAVSASTALDSAASCPTASNGGATASGSGGTSTLTYKWSNSSTNASLTRVTPGKYTVTVTDKNSCTDTASITIGSTSTLVANAVVDSNVACFGQSNGKATASATGGASPFTYSWSNSKTTSSASGLIAGSYYVTVTDGNTCTDSASVTIAQPAVLVATASVDSNVSCNGGSDGQVTVAVTGGTTLYSYEWSNHDTNATATGLSAGSFYVTVTDKNGCSDTGSVTITEPVAMGITLSEDSSISCFAGSNGQLSASVSGGAIPYTYAWSNSAATQTISGISTGIYSVTVTDKNGCTNTKTDTINQPTQLNASASVTSSYNGANISCNGSSDGEATASATGGTATYTYAWSNSTSNAIASSLSAGSFVVTVTDTKGCTDTASVSLTQPTAVLASTTLDSAASCPTATNGGATASGSGGTSTLTYKWSNSSTNASLTGVTPGKYTVTITDKNSCTDTASITIGSNSTLVANAVVDSNVACFGQSNGKATASATGGATPLTYSWSNSKTTASASGLISGTYYVTVTDGNTCTDSASVTIVQPTALNASAVVDSNVTCFGLSNGKATASASGGTSPYSYSWSTLDTTSNVSGLSASNYVVTVTDKNGCLDTVSVIPTQPSLLLASISIDSNVSCNGGSNGGATAMGQGGTLPYSFAWNTTSTTSSIVGLSKGNYSVTITDKNGCTASKTDSISQPMPLTATLSIDSNVSCFGLSNGKASTVASGGTSAYTYLWSNNATSASATGLSVGNYSVTITDKNGCTASKTGGITQPAALLASANVDSNVTCFGLSNGGASASVNGGTTPYAYLWSNSDTTLNTSGLAQGNHVVTVTDKNGCTDTAQVSILQPKSVVASIVNDSNVTCFGNANGGASASATGGSGSFTYKWNNSMNSASITGLISGTYTVTATDSLNCTDTAQVTIIQPKLLVTSAKVDSNVSCFGLSNGGASASVVGGTGPYSYQWSNADTNASTKGLGIGSYSITITDSNGCEDTGRVAITQPTVLTGSVRVDSNVSCFGMSTGGASAIPMGGTAPYRFSWSNSDTTVSVSGLTIGAYSVTITDKNGCTVSNSDTITQPLALSATLSVDSTISCNGGWNGGVSATVAGGVSPYSYLWSNNDTTKSISGIKVGSYQVRVSDSNGCSLVDTINLTQPSLFVATAVVDSNVSCKSLSNGGVSVSASGGKGLQRILWSNSDTSNSISNVMAGSYSVILTDSNGCIAQDTVIIMEPQQLSIITDSVFHPECKLDNTGYISLQTSGGTTPYKYSWNTGAALNSISRMPIGQYVATVTDTNGCTAMDTVQLMNIDSILPIAKAKNITLYLDQSGNASVTPNDINNGSSDNCGIQSLSLSTTSFSCADTGGIKVVLTVQDSSNNIGYDTSLVTVLDTISPVFTLCPSDTAICTSDTSGGIISYGNPVALDNCSFSLSQTLGLGSGAVYPLGVTQNQFTVIDGSGNQNTCSFNITINRNPVIDLGLDTNICGNAKVELKINDSTLKVLWVNDSSTAHTFITPDQGKGPIVVFASDSSTKCYSSDTVIVNYEAVCVGISENLASTASIQCFPNPSNGEFVFHAGGLSGDVKLRIYDFRGREVDSFELNDVSENIHQELKFENPVAGTYLLRVESNQGNAVYRLIIR